MLPQRRMYRPEINATVFAKLSVLLQQRLRTPEQLEQALHLLLHLKRLSKSSQQCSACYSVLVDILRGSSAQHGEAAVQTTLEVIAVTLKHDTSSCGPFVDLGVVTRLAEALHGGVTSLSAKYAVEGLHQVALSLPTSRDLILATGAVQTLVVQLQQGLQCAHYAFLKEALWTLICLADDDRLCKEAVNTSGALPAIVPLLGVDPFDAPINEFVCLPALAARALRVLAEDCSCPTSVQSDGNNKSNGSNTEYNSWQEQAVPYLVKMLSTAAGNSSGKETADEQSQQLLTRSTSNLNQRLRVIQGQVAHLFGAWILGRALLHEHAGIPGRAGSHHHTGTRSLDDSDDDDRLLGPDGNDLVDSGFLVHKTLDQAIDAAAEESLIRLLEAGPCVLDSVKEALGALKVLLAGSAAARRAATKIGAVEVVLQLLHENTDTRLAPDAADILTALTTTDSSETFLQPSSELLQQLVFVTKQLLRSCDALNEDAPVADCSQDGIAVSVELSGMKSGHSERSELSSIKEEPSQGLQPPAAPFSQTLGETPARAFAQSASLKLQAGLPPIMTRPDGQHSEAAMPVTPHLPSPEPNAPKDTDPGLTTNRGGAASTSGRPSKDFGWSGSGQTSSSFPASSSSTPHRSLSRSQSIGSTWVGSLLKRISSIRSQNSAEALDLGTGANLRHTVSFQPSQTTSALSPFALFTESKQSPAASHTPTAVQMPQPSTPLSWVPRKPSCSRHPSHPILDATVTALAKCVGSHPAYQGQAQQLGCTPLALDVLSLGRRVGVKGGLVAPAANLIRSLAEGNSQCQHLLGQAGAVGQLLALLQDASCSDLEQPDSIRLPLIGALHAVLEGNKASQLAFQAAGGVEVIMHLLAQASPRPQAPLPPSLSTGGQPEAELQDQTHTSSLPDAEDLQPTSTSQALASALVWLMGVAASDAPANQAALYQQGAVQLLLHQLQWGRATALADGSLWALGCLVKGNVDIQTETEAQGGIRLLVAYLNQESLHGESAALALHNAVALHVPNQAAARQAGAFPGLLGLLQSGPDSPTTECAARCIHALAQDCLANQDAACVAGVLLPLLEIIAAGADKLAAKSAALAVAALTNDHTANQDAVRQANGIPALIALVKAGPRNHAAVCAAGALANIAANNGINQQSVAECGGVAAVVDLLASACQMQNDSRPCIEALKALAACIDGSLPNQDAAVAAGVPACICQQASALASQSAPASELAWQVCNVLACLTSQCPSAQQACSSALVTVSALLSHPDPAVVEQACQALAGLVADCPKHQAVAEQAGALDDLMQLLLKAPPDDGDPLQWKQGLVHLTLAVLLVTADDASFKAQSQSPAGTDVDDMSVAVAPATNVSTAASSSRLGNVMALNQKVSFALSFFPRFTKAPVIKALLSLLENQQSYRQQAGRTLRYQAAEWQVHHYVADFSIQIPPLANMPYDMQSLFDIGFGD